MKTRKSKVPDYKDEISLPSLFYHVSTGKLKETFRDKSRSYIIKVRGIFHPFETTELNFGLISERITLFWNEHLERLGCFDTFADMTINIEDGDSFVQLSRHKNFTDSFYHRTNQCLQEYMINSHNDNTKYAIYTYKKTKMKIDRRRRLKK